MPSVDKLRMGLRTYKFPDFILGYEGSTQLSEIITFSAVGPDLLGRNEAQRLEVDGSLVGNVLTHESRPRYLARLFNKGSEIYLPRQNPGNLT